MRPVVKYTCIFRIQVRVVTVSSYARIHRQYQYNCTSSFFSRSTLVPTIPDRPGAIRVHDTHGHPTKRYVLLTVIADLEVLLIQNHQPY